MALMNIDTFKKIAHRDINEVKNNYTDENIIKDCDTFWKELRGIETSTEMSWFLDQFKSVKGNLVYRIKHGVSDDNMGRLLNMARELYNILGMEELYSLFPLAKGSVNYRVINIYCDRNGNWIRQVQFYGVCRSDTRKLFAQATKQVAEVLQLRYDSKKLCCRIVEDSVEKYIEMLSRMLYDAPLALDPIELSF